jgi:hypothetical protein
LRRSIPRTTHHAARNNIPIGIATHPYILFCLLAITLPWMEVKLKTASQPRLINIHTRIHYDSGTKSKRKTERRRLRNIDGCSFGCARTIFTPKISLRPFTPPPTPTTIRQPQAKKNCLKPDVGLEPTTLRLRVSRATDCASRACCC